MSVSSRLQVVLLVVGLLGLGTSSGFAFQKFDAKGNLLPDDSLTWDIVYDEPTGLYWEVKSQDESVRSNKSLYKFSKIEKQYLARLNEEKFGGFSDWRLPITGELVSIQQKGTEPYVNLNYFPNTMPSKYYSLSWCGSESEYQAASVKFGKQKIKGGKFVRAVRGKPLED